MAAVKYSYEIANDFAAGRVATSRLVFEVRDALSTSPRIDTSGGVCAVWFDSPLSSADKMILDGLIGSHFGEDLPDPDAFQCWQQPLRAVTTVAAKWTEAVSRTSVRLGSGTYVASWSLDLKISSVGPRDSKAMARFLIDGVPKGFAATNENDWSTFSGWDRLSTVAGDAPSLAIEMRRVGGDDVVEMRNMRLGIQSMG